MEWKLSDQLGRSATQAKIFFFNQELKILVSREDPHYNMLQGLIISANVKGETGELVQTWSEEENCWLYLCGCNSSCIDGREALRRAAAVVVKATEKRFREIAFVLDTSWFGLELVAAIVEGATLARSPEQPRKTDSGEMLLETAHLVIYDKHKYESAVTIASKSSMGSRWARDLTDCPANELTPAQLAKEAEKLSEKHGFSCDILDVDALFESGMNSILQVGAGSINPPCLIVIDTNPESKEKPLALVGKGITFDSGGISIKPSKDMHEMRGDMGGAAVILGALSALGELGFDRRIVAVIPAAENMTGSNAGRPGDVIKAYNGLTVEILNTDAEGRLVLADALAWTIEKYSPVATIDLATLTGAVLVALGSHAIGLMSNDEGLTQSLTTAGIKTYERVWPLPMFVEYKKQLESSIADLQNIGGREAGTITAGWFLRHFVGEENPWVHLDIAGVSWISSASGYLHKGANGTGVRLLVEMILNHWPKEKY